MLLSNVQPITDISGEETLEVQEHDDLKYWNIPELRQWFAENQPLPDKYYFPSGISIMIADEVKKLNINSVTIETLIQLQRVKNYLSLTYINN